jgi:cellulose synthase/poly-beta-1,6-N-acetylglucosamine synthase-like glycosyltransferase
MNAEIKILYIIFLLIQFLFALFFIAPVLITLTCFIKKLFGRSFNIRKRKKLINKDFDFAAIVTAHQEARFIPPLLDSLCRQTHENFIVYVVADDCDIKGLAISDPRIVILKPDPPLHVKVKSIKYALDHFKRKHDVMVIFDSDNLAHPKYFENLNEYFCRGYRAVQSHMLSKNTESIYSKLDSIGHIYNNFIERQAKMELGLSSSILGLGIAIEIDLYKEVLYINPLGGFDKKLQADLVKMTPQLAFANDAIVYDEKVDDGPTLQTQRTRWIYTYFSYFDTSWNLFITGLKRLNFNLIYFGFTILRPPLFILFAFAFTFMIIDFFIDPFSAIIWSVLILSFIISFIIIIITQSRQKGILKGLFYLPLIIIRQIRALFHFKKARKEFLNTKHIQVIYIEDLLKNESA